VQVSNHLWVLRAKPVVLSAKEKAGQTSQVSATKLIESKELTMVLHA